MKGQAGPITPVNPIYGLLHETIDETLEQLEPTQPILDENIHNARKSMKRSRAALRLLRDGMSDTAYRKENSGLRDAGRAFSPLRDARSLIDAFDSLRDRYARELEGVELAPVEKILYSTLVKARRHLHLNAPGKSAELKSCTRLLEDCLMLAKQENFSSINPGVVNSGLKRVYRKGRRAFAEAKAARTTEALHECRKQAKYLLNAIDGLTFPNRDSNSKILKWADQLGENLGDDHELATLSQEISKGDYAPVDTEVIKVLRELIERRRAKLQKNSLRLGEKLYRQKSKKFAKKVMKDVSLPSGVPSNQNL